jgi:sugar lactone lactonase YvrE
MLGRNLVQAASGTAAEADTGWDLTAATFDGTPVNFRHIGTPENVSGTAFEREVSGLFFKSDGTKMYVLGRRFDTIYEYNLSTAWDVSTGTYSQKKSVQSQEFEPNGMYIKSDGTKLYLTGASGDDVNEYNMSTAWDISTLSYVQNFSVSTEDTVPQSVFFKSDGTKMYVLGYIGKDVNEYDLSTAWDISTASYSQNFSVSGKESSPSGFFFKSDGTKMYVSGSGSDKVHEYSLSTAWDVSTASFTNSSSSNVLIDDSPRSIFLKSDGTELFLAGFATNSVFQFALSTAYSISTLSYTIATTNSLDISSKEGAPAGLTFKDDGTKLYIIGTTNDRINEYTLSTAWDITTASFAQFLSVSAQESNPQDLAFGDSGTKLYVVGTSGDEVNEYDLTTAWDISTASFNQLFSVSSEDLNPRGLAFKTDGTKMFVAGDSGNDVGEYDLSTAWDVSTASFSQRKAVGSQDFTINCVRFKPDGTKMFVVGGYYKNIYEYELSTAWDVSTASFTTWLAVGGVDRTPQAVSFKPEGDKFFTIGTVRDRIYSYTIS